MTETAALTLSDFLLARIAEDEADVEATRTNSLYVSGEVAAEDALERLANPRRLAAECEAKRRIVDLTQAAEDQAERMDGMPTLWAMEEGRASLGQAMCRALAAVYADHPDYREEWRP